MNQEQEEVIRRLRTSNIWDERLLSNTLFGRALRCITPREFFILEERIAGKAVKNIAHQLHVTTRDIRNRCTEIKRIFETGTRNDSVMSELAHKHPEFYDKLRREKDDKKDRR